MLLSDRDILAEIDAQRVALDPFDAAMVQPSSVDVRLDRFFRVFENHRYPHIDPALDQPDLTRAVEPTGDEPFILHPGDGQRQLRCALRGSRGQRHRRRPCHSSREARPMTLDTT